MPRLLDESEIKKRLKTLKEWKYEGEFITRSFEFESFMEGIAFVSRVAELAEKEEHHPDIRIRYTTITLLSQTHTEGGVTEWDFELAGAIDKMVAAMKVKPHAKLG